MKKIEQLNNHTPGGEPGKSHKRRLAEGLIEKYLSANLVIDIGAGKGPAVTPWAKIIDLDTPGYDGLHIPFEDESVDAIFSSHCLEHVISPYDTIQEWFSKIKVGGVLFITVPHQFLYEKKAILPSNWNGDHKRFYTPAKLLNEIENSLLPNTYRIRHLKDIDDKFNYEIGDSDHSEGCYEIEVIIEKIAGNDWQDFSFSRLARCLKNDNINSVVICGAGELGFNVANVLLEKGVRVSMMTDKYYDKSTLYVYGQWIPICSLKQAFATGKRTFVIASRFYKDEINSEIHDLNTNFSALNIYTI